MKSGTQSNDLSYDEIQHKDASLAQEDDKNI